MSSICLAWQKFISFSKYIFYIILTIYTGLPSWLRGKETACNAGASREAGLIPGSERSPGGENGNLL